MNSSLLVACLALLQAHTGPVIHLSSTVAVAEKGHVFELLAVVAASDPIDSLQLHLIPPENFTIQPKPLPVGSGVQLLDSTVVLLPFLAKGDSLTISYRVLAPSQWQIFGTRRTLDTTRDPKVFVYNASYRFHGDTTRQLHRLTDRIVIPYSTSLFVFLLAGMLGLFLGYTVKSLAPGSAGIDEALKGRTGFRTRLWAIVTYLLSTRLPFLLTSLAIGFGVLLALAQQRIPAGGFPTAFAIGVGLGVLGDEQLVSKLPK